MHSMSITHILETLHVILLYVYSPTPDVYWEKIDGVLPDRASFKSFGQELFISNVTESDAGQYECMGLNTESQGRATKAFEVTIQCKYTKWGVVANVTIIICVFQFIISYQPLAHFCVGVLRQVSHATLVAWNSWI